METNDFKPILKALQRYYPLGLPETEGGYDDIREVVNTKLIHQHPLMENWSKFIEELKANTKYFVEDSYYLQYPNLKVIITNNVTIEGITISKKFIICFSLLCPFYSYFYEYFHSVKRPTSGWLMLGGTYFLKDENYETFKIDIDLEKVQKLIEKYFSEFSFLHHFSLMTKEISGGAPFSDMLENGFDKKYSIYQYLFDNDYHNNNIDL